MYYFLNIDEHQYIRLTVEAQDALLFLLCILVDMIQAVVFDCFGVLYPQPGDSFLHEHRDTLSKGRAQLDELNKEIDLGIISRAQFFSKLGALVGIEPAHAQAYFDERRSVDANIITYIRQLKEHYKIGLLSNAGKEEIAVVYTDVIDTLFDAITVSYEVGDVKPNPKIYTVCAERLGVPIESCLFIDDSQRNVDGARAAGMQAVLYPTFGVIPEELKKLLS
jgi:putative hydrolase of the HAD superfamily